MLPRLKPIPIKDRVSLMFVEKSQVDVVDGAFVMIDKDGIHTQIPAGSIACMMLEPGVRISAELWSSPPELGPFSSG